MDSKLRNMTLLAVASVIALVIGMVFYVNKKPETPVIGQASENVVSGNYGEELSWEELQAFLQDETFFDTPPQEVAMPENEESPRLYLLATSVERDLRISIVDEDGNRVEGEAFFITVDGQGEYKDLDRDGLIYVPELSAGDYFVSLQNIDGYTVPDDPMRVNVKEQLEYMVIDENSFRIWTEEEIDVASEDTEVVAALEEAEDTENTQQVDPENASFGIDVSKWQREIDWAQVAAAGVDFAIIRCGYRGSSSGSLVVDPYFVQNMEGAKAAGIDVGVYFFTQAVNTVEAVEEASMVVSLCEEYELDYPVFIDTEGAGGNGRADGLDVTTRTDVCEAFCETIESAGYTAGVYASRNWYRNQLEDSRLSSYVIWVAEYRDTPLYEGNYILWQYTSGGSIPGISTRVDLNISYLESN